MYFSCASPGMSNIVVIASIFYTMVLLSRLEALKLVRASNLTYKDLNTFPTERFTTQWKLLRPEFCIHSPVPLVMQTVTKKLCRRLVPLTLAMRSFGSLIILFSGTWALNHSVSTLICTLSRAAGTSGLPAGTALPLSWSTLG